MSKHMTNYFWLGGLQTFNKQPKKQKLSTFTDTNHKQNCLNSKSLKVHYYNK